MRGVDGHIAVRSQHSILIAWPLNLSDRLTNTFLIDAQKGEVLG